MSEDTNFDNLIKGLAVFRQGMQQLAVTGATNDAQKQLNELNAQGLSEQDRLKAQAQIGNNLALRMQAGGADAAQISAIANRLTPSGSEERQLQFAQSQQESSQKFTAGQNEANRQNLKDIAKMKLDAASGKSAGKVYGGLGTEFDRLPDVKPMLDNFPKLDTALDQIRSSKGQMGATAMINLAQLGLIRGAAGRVNEKEIEGANESQSKRAQLWKKMGLETTGEVPLNIQDFWEKVVKRSKDNAQMYISDHAAGFAKSKALENDMVDEDTLHKSLLLRHNFGPSSAPPPPSVPGSAAPVNNSSNPWSQYLSNPGK